jgi:hypothetical protein
MNLLTILLFCPRLRITLLNEIPGPPTGRTLRGANSKVQQADEYICRVSMLLKRAIDSRWADAIKSCRRALYSGLLHIEDTVTRAAQAKHWELSLVEMMMQDVDGSTCDLMKEAYRVIQERIARPEPTVKPRHKTNPFR